MITPCRHCTDRYESCHSECDKYKEWRQALDKDRERIMKVKIKEGDIHRLKQEAVFRAIKSKRT